MPKNKNSAELISAILNKLGRTENSFYQKLDSKVDHLPRWGIVGEMMDGLYTNVSNVRADSRLASSMEQASRGMLKYDTRFVRLSQNDINEANLVRISQKQNPLKDRTITAFKGALNNSEHRDKHINDGSYKNYKELAKTVKRVLLSKDKKILPGSSKSKNTIFSAKINGRNESVSLGDTKLDKVSLKNVSPRKESWIKNKSSEKQKLLNNISDGEAQPSSYTERSASSTSFSDFQNTVSK